MTWAEFQMLLGLGPNAMIVKRVFDMLDCNRDGIISRDDFLAGLSPLESATEGECRHVLFDCLDLDDSDAISRESLLVHLHRASLIFSQSSSTACRLSLEQIERITDATFTQAQLDENGRIGRRAFSELLERHPAIAERVSQQVQLRVEDAIASHLLAFPSEPEAPAVAVASDNRGLGAQVGPSQLCLICMRAAAICGLRQTATDDVDVVVLVPRDVPV